MAGTVPPIFPITDDDHGGYVCVVSYTLVALTVVTVVARLSTRWYIGRLVMPDDILLAVATVCKYQVQLPNFNQLIKRLWQGPGNLTECDRTIGSRSRSREEDTPDFVPRLYYIPKGSFLLVSHPILPPGDKGFNSSPPVPSSTNTSRKSSSSQLLPSANSRLRSSSGT